MHEGTMTTTTVVVSVLEATMTIVAGETTGAADTRSIVGMTALTRIAAMRRAVIARQIAERLRGERISATASVTTLSATDPTRKLEPDGHTQTLAHDPHRLDDSPSASSSVYSDCGHCQVPS